MTENRIPTASHPQPVELTGERGIVFVRRMKASVRDAIAKHVGLTEKDQGTAMAFGQYALRWGVIRSEGLTDPTGEVSNEQIEKRTTLRSVGSIASQALYDVVSMNLEDYSDVLILIMGDDAEDILKAGQQGNLPSSPTGSTENE